MTDTSKRSEIAVQSTNGDPNSRKRRKIAVQSTNSDPNPNKREERAEQSAHKKAKRRLTKEARKSRDKRKKFQELLELKRSRDANRDRDENHDRDEDHDGDDNHGKDEMEVDPVYPVSKPAPESVDPVSKPALDLDNNSDYWEAHDQPPQFPQSSAQQPSVRLETTDSHPIATETSTDTIVPPEERPDEPVASSTSEQRETRPDPGDSSRLQEEKIERSQSTIDERHTTSPIDRQEVRVSPKVEEEDSQKGDRTVGSDLQIVELVAYHGPRNCYIGPDQKGTIQFARRADLGGRYDDIILSWEKDNLWQEFETYNLVEHGKEPYKAHIHALNVAEVLWVTSFARLGTSMSCIEVAIVKRECLKDSARFPDGEPLPEEPPPGVSIGHLPKKYMTYAQMCNVSKDLDKKDYLRPKVIKYESNMFR